MLRLVRIIGLAFWSLFLVLVYFTTETVADELGWTQKVRETVKAGPSAMLDISYDVWVLSGFWLLTGAMAVAWGELLFRKWEDRRKVNHWQHFTVDWTDGTPIVDKRVGVEAITMLDGQVMGNIYDSDPKVSRNAITLIVQFDREIAEPCPYVFADRRIIWREANSGAHFLVLEIDLRSKEDVAFSVIVRPKAWSDGVKFDAAMRWHDATEMPRDQVLQSPKAERRPSRWLPGIATGMLRRIRPG